MISCFDTMARYGRYNPGLPEKLISSSDIDKCFSITALVRVVPGYQCTVAAGDFITAGIGLKFEYSQRPGLFINRGEALPEVIY